MNELADIIISKLEIKQQQWDDLDCRVSRQEVHQAKIVGFESDGVIQHDTYID